MNGPCTGRRRRQLRALLPVHGAWRFEQGSQRDGTPQLERVTTVVLI
jgi:hypothetical protein